MSEREQRLQNLANLVDNLSSDEEDCQKEQQINKKQSQDNIQQTQSIQSKEIRKQKMNYQDILDQLSSDEEESQKNTTKTQQQKQINYNSIIQQFSDGSQDNVNQKNNFQVEFQKYNDPKLCYSLFCHKIQNEFIDQMILQDKEDNKIFLMDQKKIIENQKSFLINLNAQKYQELVKNSLIANEQLIKDKLISQQYQTLIQNRIETMKKEFMKLQEQGDVFFQKLIQIYQLQNQPQQQSQNLPNKEKPQQNQLDTDALLKIHYKRHKQFCNLANYLSTVDSGQRNEFVQKNIIPLIQKSKDYLVQYESKKIYNCQEIQQFFQKDFMFTPEIFHGYSLDKLQQQIKAYSELLLKSIKQEAEIQKKIDIKQTSQIEKCKNRQKIYQNLMQELQLILQNPYRSLLFKLKIEKEQNQVILENRQIQPTDINIMLFAIESEKSFTKLKYTLANNFQDYHSKDITWNDVSKLNHQQSIQIYEKKRCIRDIYTKKIEVTFYAKGTLFGIFEKEKAQALISLQGLQENNTQSGFADIINIQLILQFRKQNQIIGKLKYAVQTRIPCSESVSSIATIVVLDTQYPVFEPSLGLDEYLSQKLPQYFTTQAEQTQINKQKQQDEHNIQIQEEIVMIPIDSQNSSFQKLKIYLEKNHVQNKELVLEPDNPELCICMSFFDEYIKVLEKNKKLVLTKRPLYNKIDQKYQLFQKQTMIIQMSIENEKLSVDQYKQLLKNCQATDKDLIQIYQQLQIQEWISFILSRLKYVDQELKSFE